MDRSLLSWCGAVLSGVFAAGGLCGCQSGMAGGADHGPVALKQPQTDGPLVLHVRSDAFDAGEEIPLRNSAYGDNVSPSLSWSGVPTGARSIAVIVEDPDAPQTAPYVHWVLYGLGGDVTNLPAGLPPEPTLSTLAGARQGRNSHGSVGYFGPRPPRGDPAHHYHFQVFALDRMLTLSPGASRDALVDAMAGHVIGKGEVVGTYRE